MNPRITTLLTILFTAVQCAVYKQDLSTAACSPDEIRKHKNTEAIQQALDQLLLAGVPGAVLAVYSEEGWYETARGLAKIEDQSPMQTCHLQYLQSISKTYMAVAILKLAEQGKLDLDASISNYLPEGISRSLTSAEKITVRMLLNHTSGLPEYNDVPAYVTQLLQQPYHEFTPTDFVQYIHGKPLDFEPGSRFSYRNLNYVLLALMADVLTGNHAAFITEQIFKPLNLTNTFYRHEANYLNYPQLVNAYWDRYSNSILENVSQLQRNNVASMVGDDGIVTTPTDAVKFLKGLMEGKLLTPDMLQQMMTWVPDRKGNPTYGLGLDHSMLAGQVAWGHSGGGLGAGCQLYYFPEKKVYLFAAINLGTVTESPIHQKAEKALDELYHAVLKQ